MTTAEMIKLREQGLTYKAIADRAGITPQAVHFRVNPKYQQEYRRKYNEANLKRCEYQRHYQHNKTNPNKIFDNCERCLTKAYLKEWLGKINKIVEETK
jgi:hypothetical protein